MSIRSTTTPSPGLLESNAPTEILLAAERLTAPQPKNLSEELTVYEEMLQQVDLPTEEIMERIKITCHRALQSPSTEIAKRAHTLLRAQFEKMVDACEGQETDQEILEDFEYVVNSSSTFRELRQLANRVQSENPSHPSITFDFASDVNQGNIDGVVRMHRTLPFKSKIVVLLNSLVQISQGPFLEGISQQLFLQARTDQIDETLFVRRMMDAVYGVERAFLSRLDRCLREDGWDPDMDASQGVRPTLAQFRENQKSNGRIALLTETYQTLRKEGGEENEIALPTPAPTRE